MSNIRDVVRPLLRPGTRRPQDIGGGFSPSLLFASGAPGVWYDRQDLSTMYQDSAGTTACAVGSPVGLALDKSKGLVLGVERVTNGTFDADVSGWSALSAATVSWVGGELCITSTGIGAGGASFPLTGLTVGSRYLLQATGRRGTTTGSVIADISGIGNSRTNATTANAPLGYSFVATAVSHTLQLYMNSAGAAGQTAFFDNISVREIPGNHATQGTSPSRPLLQQDAGGRYYNAPDGFDDSHTAASGGGASAGFFFCAAITVLGGAGTIRTIWSDAGTNTGYRVRINAANQLEFSAGNGVAFTAIATVATLPVGETHVITAWDDGTNLKVQIDGGAVASVARPVVSAGTAGFTLYKDNGAASSFANVGDYVMVYRGSAPTATEIARTQRYAASKGGVTL